MATQSTTTQPTSLTIPLEDHLRIMDERSNALASEASRLFHRSATDPSLTYQERRYMTNNANQLLRRASILSRRAEILTRLSPNSHINTSSISDHVRSLIKNY